MSSHRPSHARALPSSVVRALSPWLAWAGLLVIVLSSSTATALPTIRTATDTVDDATLTIAIMDRTLVPDARSWCQLTLDVLGSDVSFRSGDKIYLWVYEDDTPGNDLIWQHNFTITATEVTANRVQRSFDCSADFDYDGFGDNLEIFAEARVEKDACGTFCVWDRPSTPSIDTIEVDDDTFENDDTQATARTVGLGTTTGYVSRDQDWFTFTTTSVSRVTFDAVHYPSVGRIDLALFDPSSAPFGAALVTDLDDRTRLEVEALPAGTWLVRVSPRMSNDPNFYDVVFGLDSLATTCAPSATETRACGNCGNETRTCASDGSWGTWSGCQGEGECQPGADESAGCDAGNGADGTRERTCEASCTWGTWSACVAEPCTEGETRPCFSGAIANRNVGACRDGVQTCTGGVFGACTQEVLPQPEICGNDTDDDCDGSSDALDDDCATPTGSLGDVCTDDTDCGTWACLGAPDEPRFSNGYCGRQQDCTGAPGECGPSGVCGTVGATDYCLKRCGGLDDCRADYLCLRFDGGYGCAPRCRNNDDCPHPDGPVCDLLTGACVSGQAPDDASPGDDVSPGSDTTSGGSDTSADASDGDVADPTTPITADASCACRVTASPSVAAPYGRSAALLLLALGMVGLIARRRRRR